MLTKNLIYGIVVSPFSSPVTGLAGTSHLGKETVRDILSVLNLDT